MCSLQAASIIAVHFFTGCLPVSFYNASKILQLDLYTKLPDTVILLLC